MIPTSRSRLNMTGAAVMVMTFLTTACPRSAESSVSYEYDVVGRAATALYDNGTCVVYTYDANGNRTAQVNFPAPGTPTAWGAASWGGFTWTSTAQSPVWGSGIWGCFEWTP